MTKIHNIDGKPTTVGQINARSKVSPDTVRRRIANGATSMAELTERVQRTWRGKAHPWKSAR